MRIGAASEKKYDYSNFSDKKVLRYARRFVRKLDRYLQQIEVMDHFLEQVGIIREVFPRFPLPDKTFLPYPHQSRIDHWREERDYWRNVVETGVVS